MLLTVQVGLRIAATECSHRTALTPPRPQAVATDDARLRVFRAPSRSPMSYSKPRHAKKV
jgi:hypothetical protein